MPKPHVMSSGFPPVVKASAMSNLSAVIPKTRAAIAVAAIAALALVCGCNVEISRDVQAVCLKSDGNVTITRVGATRGAQEGARVHVADLLTTDGVAAVDVSLLPGALIKLARGAQLRVDRLRLTKNGNRVQEAIRRDVGLTLSRGEVTFCVLFETSVSPVTLATPGGELKVMTPALFRVETNDGRTRVTCARGTVRLEPADGSPPVTLIGPSFRDWPPPSSEPIPVEFDVAATAEIENLREVERKLLGLQDRSRLAPYPWRQ